MESQKDFDRVKYPSAQSNNISQNEAYEIGCMVQIIASLIVANVTIIVLLRSCAKGVKISFLNALF